MTLTELLADLELIDRALASATVYVAGHDQAEDARSLRERRAWSALRTLLEQAKDAAVRVSDHMQPPTQADPCIPPDAIQRP